MSAKTKIPFIKMLSEYRAIQVQMKISMNFEIYNEDKKFSFDDKTHDWFEEKTVKEDIINTLFGLEFDIFHHMLSKIDNKDINYFKLLLSSQNKMVGYFGLHEDEIIKTLGV